MDHEVDDIMSQDILQGAISFTNHFTNVNYPTIEEGNDLENSVSAQGSPSPTTDPLSLVTVSHQPQEENECPPPMKKAKRAAGVKRATSLTNKRTNGTGRNKTTARNNHKQIDDMTQKVAELEEQNLQLAEKLKQINQQLLTEKLQTQLMSCQLVSERQDFFSILDLYHHKVFSAIHGDRLEELTELSQKINNFRDDYARLNQKLVTDVKNWLFKG